MAAGEWSAVEGKRRGGALVRKTLAILAVAVAAFWAVALLQPTPVDATSHRAVRSFSASWVLPDGRLEVTITPTGYGSIGQVVETLPAGFSYSGSDLSDSQVAADGRTVTFTLLGEEAFAYTVTAPAAAGSYEFSGIIKDVDKAEASVAGASSIRVGPPPTPAPTSTPTPTPTPTPTSTPTPTPTLTPVPSPTPTPTPAPATTPERTATATLVPTAAPTATPEPTATAAPEPTPEPTAAATPEPTAEPTATLEPTASPTPQIMLVVEPTATPAPTATVVVAAAGDGPPGILWLIPVVVLLGLVLAVLFYLRTRR